MPSLGLSQQGSRGLRWGVPAVVVVALVAAGPVLHAVTANADNALPSRTPAQLLVDVHDAKVTALSGTVVETTNLGLPALPSLGGDGGNSADFSSLVSGSHTMRVWYGGPGKLRLALLGQLGESDLVRNGSDVWAWSSHDNTATHWTLPTGSSEATPSVGSTAGAAVTPQQAAQTALRAISPSTKVTTDPTAVVAGRSAYQLDLVPRDPRSLVGSVRIAIDGATHVPTRVQVFARGATSPAFQVGFTSFSTTAPDDSVFGFTPPPGATVKQAHGMTVGSHAGHASAKNEPKVVGKGWTSVVVTRLPKGTSVLPSTRAGAPAQGQAHTQSTSELGALLRSLPTVSGSWGSGHVLRGALFSAVLTDDGRVAIGAVPPRLLYAALSR